MARDWKGQKPSLKVDTGTIFRIVDGIAKKKLAPSTLSYKQWREMPEEIKRRSMFSAKLFQAEHLSDIKKKLIENLEGKRIKVRESSTGRKYWESKGMLDEINPRTGVKYGDEYVLQSRSMITRDLIDLAKERGIQPTGTEYDVEWQGHPSRVDVIFDTNIKQAINTANFNAGQDEDILAFFPAYEFGRLAEAEEPRDWPSRWQEAGDSIGWAGASKEKMIALKNSPIWGALNQISPGNQIPPYDWNSNMGWLREVNRAEAESLGILDPKQRLSPAPIDLNKETMADVSSLDQWTLKQLMAEFPKQIQKVGKKVFFRA